MLAEDAEIFNLLEGQPTQEPDDLINTLIFPQIKITFTDQETKTYIGLKIDYPSICRNELYKNYLLTIMIISNNNHLKAANGESRPDLIAEEIIDLLNWNNNIGFTLELVSDIENPLDNKYYYRELKFKSIKSNGVENGMKKYD